MDANHNSPLYDRRKLPSAFASGAQLPPGLRAQVETHCALTGENFADVLHDALVLLLDEAAGATYDETELGFALEGAKPEPPGAPEACNAGTHAVPQAPPAGAAR